MNAGEARGGSPSHPGPEPEQDLLLDGVGISRPPGRALVNDRKLRRRHARILAEALRARHSEEPSDVVTKPCHLPNDSVLFAVPRSVDQAPAASPLNLSPGAPARRVAHSGRDLFVVNVDRPLRPTGIEFVIAPDARAIEHEASIADVDDRGVS
jgi:hypothetical protein